MLCKVLIGILTAFQLISSAWSYGTIVEIYPATCAALPTGPGFQSVQYLLLVSPGPISIIPKLVASSYIRADGRTTANCSAAALFTLSNGQLSSNGQFISTAGLVPYSPLAVSPSLAAISTTFSMTNRSTLAWNNPAFVGGHALFCVMGNVMEAVYDGQLPAGCAQIFIDLVPANSCQAFNPSGGFTQHNPSSTGAYPLPSASTPSVPGSIRGRNATASPVGCLTSSLDSPAVSPALPPKFVTTLEQCLDICSSFSYFGVQSAVCLCGNALAPSATAAPYRSCNATCLEDSRESCGGDNAMVVYSVAGRGSHSSTSTIRGITTGTGTTITNNGSTSATIANSATTSSSSGFATSTGIPNCFDRSPFDQTVNAGYLILCNTALTGFDLLSVNGTNLAECIAACDAYSSGPAGSFCVAVTFETVAISNQCKLKNGIGAVRAGADDLSDSAIVVAGENAPPIVFASAASTMGPTMSSTDASTGAVMTSTTTTMMTTTTSSTGASSTSFLPTEASSTEVISTEASSSMTSTMVDPSDATSSIDTLTTDETITVPSTSTETTSMTSTSQGPIATISDPSDSGELCPQYNGLVVKIGENFYQVECSTGFTGEILVTETTTAGSLSECGGFCNLYNLAVPYGCVGAILLTASDASNCYIMSTITGRLFNPLDDSLRLIYPGYPSPTDPILTATATATTSAASTSSDTSTSTGFTTSTSTSSGATATGDLCPAYNAQLVFFPAFAGANYEIECSTDLVGNDLESIIATDLEDCVNQCQFLNLNNDPATPQCVGVTLLNTLQTNPPLPNCFPKSAITTIVRGVLSDDSARLIYPGYPSATNLASPSSTTTSA